MLSWFARALRCFAEIFSSVFFRFSSSSLFFEVCFVECVLFLLGLKLLADGLIHSLMSLHLLHLRLLKFVHQLLEFLLCLGQLPLALLEVFDGLLHVLGSTAGIHWFWSRLGEAGSLWHAWCVCPPLPR